MATLRTFHPCQFQYKQSEIGIMGSVVSGGKSLSGYEDKVAADGGGYLTANFTNGSIRTKENGNALKALITYLAGGTTAVIVLLCAERLFQPVGAIQKVPHSDATSFDDATLYTSPGAAYKTTVDAPLRATSLTIVGSSEKPLIGGELFSVQHNNWGWRAYRIHSVTTNRDLTQTVQFLPPLRESMDSGTAMEFDTPRCQMVLGSDTSSPISMGRFGTNDIQFVEDMSNPETS